MKSSRLFLIMAAVAALGFAGCNEENDIIIQGENAEQSVTDPDNPKQDNPDPTDGSKDPETPVTSNDLDGDGLSNDLEATLGTDPNKADTDDDSLKDGDEIAKGTDPNKADTDDDGLNDADEIAKGTDPNKADSDDDGLNDSDEIAKGTDPLKADTDADDLNDGQEVELGTDPLKSDTDGDGISDGEEVAKGTDPLKATVDADGDGLTDDQETELSTDPNKADTDDDGASDLVEYMLKTNPTDAADNPDSHNLTWFLAPYQKTVSPASATQSFIPVVQKLDVYFDGKIQEFNSGEKTITTALFKTLDSLKCSDSGIACQSNADCASYNGGTAICGESGTCIQQSTTKKPCIADLWTGAGSYGNANTFVNNLSLQADINKTRDTIIGFSSDANADYVHSTACAIGGTQYCTNTDKIKCYSGDDRFGCVGYRKDAIKGLFLSAHRTSSVGWNSSDDNRKKAGKIITDNNIRLMAISWAPCSCNNGVSQLVCYAHACDSNQSCFSDCSKATSLCSTRVDSIYFGGTSLINKSWDNNYDTQIKHMATNRVVTIEPKVVAVTENADKLIQKLTVNKSGNTAKNGKCTAISNAISDDAFQTIASLTPGTSICYDITPVDSQSVIPATNEPQLLEARVQVTAEGSVLNSDHVYFIVPPAL